MPLLADSLRKAAPPEDPRIERLREELQRLLTEDEMVPPEALLQARMNALRQRRQDR